LAQVGSDPAALRDPWAMDAMPLFVILFMWLSVLMGTIFGFIYGFASGPAKICHCHPKYTLMVFAMDNVWAPFLGCNGRLLRIFTSLGEITAGIGLIIGLWGDAFCWFPKGLDDLAKALIIVAGCGLMTLAWVAASIHKYIDGSRLVNGPLASSLTIFTLIRIFFNGPVLRFNQLLCTYFCMGLVVIALITLVCNKIWGQHQSAVEKDNKKLKGMA